MLGTMIHPSESFGLVKEKGMGSVGIGIILALLFYACRNYFKTRRRFPLHTVRS